MTSIRDRILARADLADLRAARDLDGLAAALNEQPESVMQSTFITARAILAKCAQGPQILQALETAATKDIAVSYAVKFLSQDAGLDVGDLACQALIDKLVPAVLSAEQAQEIKSLALHAVYVTRDQVYAAMFNPDGSEQ